MSEPLMPLVMFRPAFAPVGAAGRKRAHIWPFSIAENGGNSARNFAEIQQIANAEFLHPYMGLFWSGATAFFSKSVVPLTRLLKNGNSFQGLLNFRKFPLAGKMRIFSIFPPAGNPGVWTAKRRRYHHDTAAALYPVCFFLRGPLGLEVGLRLTPFRK